jgi:hypothetical protein
MDREDNPNCTAWCTGPGGTTPSRGHAAVPEETMRQLRRAAAAFLGADGASAPEQRLRAAVDPLYRLDSWGYHAIADALGKPHEWAYMVLTGQEPPS